MPELAVIVPTLTGREESLERTLRAYEQTLLGVDWELIVVRDEPSWPGACNAGYERSTGDVVHFGADDLVPVQGWWEAASRLLQTTDELPAARVWDYNISDLHHNHEDGPDGAITWFTRVPILRRDQYERIGTWPIITYYADVWLSDRGRAIGIETRLVYNYQFIHHWSQIKRVDGKENMEAAWAQYVVLHRKLQRLARRNGRTLTPPAPAI